jgi:hypothetical protein
MRAGAGGRKPLSHQFQIKALPSLAHLRLLNVLPVRLRRLDPRRLGFIFDLELESEGVDAVDKGDQESIVMVIEG